MAGGPGGVQRAARQVGEEGDVVSRVPVLAVQHLVPHVGPAQLLQRLDDLRRPAHRQAPRDEVVLQVNQEEGATWRENALSSSFTYPENSLWNLRRIFRRTISQIVLLPFILYRVQILPYLHTAW